MANEANFTRDLGYLDKFFVNISAFADTLPEAESSRLKQLMAEETQRWAEIRGLLGAGPMVAAPPAPPRGADEEAPPPKPTVSTTATVPTPKPAKERPSWTVGGLFGQPKK